MGQCQLSLYRPVRYVRRNGVNAQENGRRLDPGSVEGNAAHTQCTIQRLHLPDRRQYRQHDHHRHRVRQRAGQYDRHDLLRRGKHIRDRLGQACQREHEQQARQVFQETGTNSFADGLPNSGDHDTVVDGMCQVCHTRTKYFNRSGLLDTGPSGTHPVSAAVNCVDCHNHMDGFKASCSGCHGYPPSTDVAVSPNGLVWKPEPTGSVTGSSHVKHAAGGTNYNYSCDTCHYNGMPATAVNGNKKIQIGFNQFGGTIPNSGTTYKGQNLTNGYSYEFTNGTTTGTAVFQCTNIYCHGNYPGSGKKASATWGNASSVTCGSCHGASSAASPASGSHSRHTDGSDMTENIRAPYAITAS